MEMSMGLNINDISSGYGGSGSFLPQSTALFARMTTPPTRARKILINNLIGSLITGGVWAKMDALYVMAAADSQSALLNWMQSTYNLTVVSTPTFTADRGYAGNGVDAYLDTGFGPSVAVTPKYTQNSASFGVWSRSVAMLTQQLVGQNSNVIVPTSGVNANVRVNNSTVLGTGANTLSDGFFLANRSGAAAETLRRNKANIITTATASSSPDASTFTFGKRIVSFSTVQMAAGFIGSSLSTTESDAFYDAMLVYLQGVGAA